MDHGCRPLLQPEIATRLPVTLGGNNVFDVHPDKWGRAAGQAFYEAGFTFGWETPPFGINGGYCYLNLAYSHR